MENITDAELMKSTRLKLTCKDGHVYGRREGDKELSQAMMAEYMNYSGQQAISKIERGVKGLSGPARKALELVRKYEAP